jgi:hypothetical protein
MKFHVTARKTVTVFTLVISTTLIVMIILVSIRPISLPLLSSYFKDQFANKFEGYVVEFAAIQAQWRPLEGNIDLHFDSISVNDQSNNSLANVPKALLKINTNSIFNETKDIKTIELHNPNISLIRSSRNKLNFDVGNTNRGASNKVFATLLLFAEDRSQKAGEQHNSSVNLRIINSDLMISDEMSGSLLHASNAYVNVSTNKSEIKCRYEFNIFASGEIIHLNGDCSHNHVNGNSVLTVNVDKVRPALLTEFFPVFAYFSPIEVQLSGILQFEFDELLQVNKATFDLVSENGSLEVIEAIGNNLNINSLHIAGSALNQFSHISLDRLSIALEDNHIEADALFLKNRNILDLKLNVLIQGSSIAELLPRWFAYLKTEQLDCIEEDDDEYHYSSISIDGTYDLSQNKINALGHFICHEYLLSINSFSSDGNLSSTVHNDLNFRMDGTLDSPNLSTAR